MRTAYCNLGGLAATLCLASLAQAQVFTNQTTTRMPVGPGLNTAALSQTDNQEKDYAWGDVDQDGDIDLVNVRKEPWTTAGRRQGVLFMNEGIAEGHSINGVLVDRTAQYASASNAPAWDDPLIVGGSMPDQGLLTPVNNRDVLLVDMNNDTWLDIVTATTISDGTPHHIGHPRIYINLGESGGVWQGFQYQVGRIPAMVTATGMTGQHPRFCSVGAGDVTGDGYVDLYFGDYDSSGAGGLNEPAGVDFNNKFLINQGAANPGFFTDTTTTRINANPGLLSAFGAASLMADMNGDGFVDIVKQTSLNAPLHNAVHINNPNNPGFFPTYHGTYNWNPPSTPAGAPYFVSAGDLNNDGRLDLVITDDGTDAYQLNTGNAAGANGALPQFTTLLFPGGTNGFGSQSAIADLNNDGWLDVLISDVDVDIEGCSRRLHILRNNGNAPNVTFADIIPAGGMTTSFMTGTYHTAVFDINQDGWLDIVIGRCSGTQVWMQTPPAGITFTFPEGLPSLVEPDQPHTFDVQLSAIGSGTLMANSGRIFISQNGGPYVQQNMTSLGGNLYEATLPPTVCPQPINFYFTGQLSTGATFTDPPGAPTNAPYVAAAAQGTEITLNDDLEGDVSQWTVQNDPTNTAGAWQVADPNGTINAGALAAPEDDATGGPAVNAFVTQNGAPGGAPGLSDVDGGPTHLLSPVLDLAGTDATISYERWFYREPTQGDTMTVHVSNNNGATWTLVDTVTGTSNGVNTGWEVASFVVGDFVVPSATVRVRFTAADTGSASLVEAGIDDFTVNQFICDDVTPCPADINTSGAVDVSDLLAVISAWGPCPRCPADITGDGNVNVSDLLAVVAGWGTCP